jgi:phage tail-like protein
LGACHEESRSVLPDTDCDAFDGLIGDLGLFAWLRATQDGRRDPRTVTITLLDETRTPVCVFVLHRAQPKKWIGPELSAKGGGEVAMEELHLVAERIDFQSV